MQGFARRTQDATRHHDAGAGAACGRCSRASASRPRPRSRSSARGTGSRPRGVLGQLGHTGTVILGSWRSTFLDPRVLARSSSARGARAGVPGAARRGDPQRGRGAGRAVLRALRRLPPRRSCASYFVLLNGLAAEVIPGVGDGLERTIGTVGTFVVVFVIADFLELGHPPGPAPHPAAVALPRGPPLAALPQHADGVARALHGGHDRQHRGVRPGGPARRLVPGRSPVPSRSPSSTTTSSTRTSARTSGRCATSW